MKEDYLWDKTGENPQIERLENALKAFRYQEIAPPALPAKVLPLEEKTPRRMFNLAFAFAACTAFVIVALGVWFQYSSRKFEVAKHSVETVAPQINKEISVEKQNDFIVENVKTPKQSVEQKIIKVKKIIPTNIRRNNLTARNVKAKKLVVKLTKEEKYAYHQLILALSIASSKLKLVTDKIDGVEEQNIVLENER